MISTRLLRWYDQAGRTLPWRNTRDAYHILVSEIMLQQTQVQRVLIFYTRWLITFPDWTTLARATNAQVIHAWAGLGYNRRALMLRDIARSIGESGIPQNEEEWLRFKGIGPYTAAALTVFSLHQPATPIDTNIRRVLARVMLGIPFPDKEADHSLKTVFKNHLLRGKRFFDLPQALFDLATMICTKKPACAICPLRISCKSAPAFLAGTILTPKAMHKKVKETKHRNKPYPDRIYRGRILTQVRTHPKGISPRRLGVLIDQEYESDRDEEWLLRMIDRLIHDQFMTLKGTRLFLKTASD